MENHSRQELLALLEEAEVAILSTVGAAGYPHTRALLNLRNKEQWPGLVELFAADPDDFAVYFATNASSSKVAQIRENPKVNAYYFHFDRTLASGPPRGLMLLGEAEIVDDAELKRALWHDWWTMYYPKGLEDPDYAVIRLRPTRATYYHNLKSTELQLSG